MTVVKHNKYTSHCRLCVHADLTVAPHCGYGNVLLLLQQKLLLLLLLLLVLSLLH